ncbi:hypothetical protein P7C70_g3182, partial [Phenoliferia sp. Uapishka_3]
MQEHKHREDDEEFALPPLSASGSPNTDDFEEDDDNAPLLPISTTSPSSSFPSPSPSSSSSKRDLSLTVTLLCAAVLCAAGLLAIISHSSSPSLPFADFSHPSQFPPIDFTNYSTPSRTPSHVAAWLASPTTENRGFVPFLPSAYSPLLPLRPLSQTLSVKGFSEECADSWIADGELCAGLKGRWKGVRAPRMDVAWTWTNGSENELMTQWRKEVASEGARTKTSSNVLKHFRSVTSQFTSHAHHSIQRTQNRLTHLPLFSRDHDELRHSLRSIIASFSPSSLRALHLIVGDSPACIPTEFSCLSNHSLPHAAQIPHWLNLAEIEFATGEEKYNFSKRAGERETTRFVVHPHSAIFKTPAYTEVGEEDENVVEGDEKMAMEWRNNVVPSFNSLAIESQIPNMEDVEDTLLNLNDDFFIMRKLSVSDVSSPITGPVFRVQKDLAVNGVAPEYSKEDPDGEWRGLGYTNWLMDQRFGKRSRPYIVHEGKSVSIPILREAQDTFVDELTATAEARFRGRGPSEVQSSFLLVHYTIEKHREALLWSFFFGRSDENQDGVFSASERTSLLEALGHDGTSPTISVSRPHRSSLEDYQTSYDFVGLERPKETTMKFSSADGYPYFIGEGVDYRHGPWPTFGADDTTTDRTPLCTIDINACFGADFANAKNGKRSPVVDSFRRSAFAIPECGDCIIVSLLGKSSSRGLSAFLPPQSSTPSSPSPISSPEIAAVGLSASSFSSIDFSLPPSSIPIRTRCIALIQRYSYVIGDSPVKFVTMKSKWTLGGAFRDMDRSDGMPAFLAINDDLGSYASPAIVDGANEVLEKWFEDHLGKKKRLRKVTLGRRMKNLADKLKRKLYAPLHFTNLVCKLTSVSDMQPAAMHPPSESPSEVGHQYHHSATSDFEGSQFLSERGHSSHIYHPQQHLHEPRPQSHPTSAPYGLPLPYGASQPNSYTGQPSSSLQQPTSFIPNSSQYLPSPFSDYSSDSSFSRSASTSESPHDHGVAAHDYLSQWPGAQQKEESGYGDEFRDPSHRDGVQGLGSHPGGDWNDARLGTRRIPYVEQTGSQPQSPHDLHLLPPSPPSLSQFGAHPPHPGFFNYQKPDNAFQWPSRLANPFVALAPPPPPPPTAFQSLFPFDQSIFSQTRSRYLHQYAPTPSQLFDDVHNRTPSNGQSPTPSSPFPSPAPISRFIPGHPSQVPMDVENSSAMDKEDISDLRPDAAKRSRGDKSIPASKAKADTSELPPQNIAKATTSRKTKKVTIEVDCTCVVCAEPLARLIMRATRDEYSAPYSPTYTCAKCEPRLRPGLNLDAAVPASTEDQEPVASGSKAKVAPTRTSFRKKSKRADGTNLVSCDVCLKDVASGAVVYLGGGGAEVSFPVEFICLSCTTKYRRCSDCGGGWVLTLSYELFECATDVFL